MAPWPTWPWQLFGGLAQNLHARVGRQRALAAGALQRVGDELREAFALDHGFEGHAHLDAAGQWRVRGAL